MTINPNLLVYLIIAAISVAFPVLVYMLFRIQVDSKQVAKAVAEALGYVEGTKRYTRIMELQERILLLVGPMARALADDPDFERKLTDEVVAIIQKAFPDFDRKEIVAMVIRIMEEMAMSGAMPGSEPTLPVDEEGTVDDDIAHIMGDHQIVVNGREMTRFYSQLRDQR